MSQGDITAGAEAIAKADGWTDREITSRAMGALQWQTYQTFATAALASRKTSAPVESQTAPTPIHIDNRAPIWRTYVARAEENDRGRGFVGKYAFPGGSLRVVYAAGTNTPDTFATAEAAENEARRVLVESLNARYRDSASRNSVSRKLTGDEFAIELAAADITASEWAQMWGTKQDTVVAQIQGEKDVPFAARWILPVLRDSPRILATAQNIVAENTTIKPEWIERKRKRVENQEAKSS